MPTLPPPNLVDAVNSLRSDSLYRFIDDLSAVTPAGFDDEDSCSRIKDALLRIKTRCESADGGFKPAQRTLAEDVRTFRYIYSRWNDVKGKSAKAVREREKAITKLTKRSGKMVARLAPQGVLWDAIDLALIKDIYEEWKSLSNDLPDVFPHLKRAVERFEARQTSWGDQR